MPILPMSWSRAAWPISVASEGFEAERACEQLARAADAVGVLARRVVAVLRRECQPVEHLELGVLELGASAAATRSWRRSLWSCSSIRRKRVWSRLRTRSSTSGDVDRLRQEVAGAERQRPALGVRCDVGREHQHGHPVRLLGEEGDVLEDLGPVPARAFASRAVPGRAASLASLHDRQRFGERRRPSGQPARSRMACSQGVHLLVVDHGSAMGAEAGRPPLAYRTVRLCGLSTRVIRAPSATRR